MSVISYLYVFSNAFCSVTSLVDSDVRSKSFQAVDQFLQILKQNNEKVCNAHLVQDRIYFVNLVT